MNRPWRHLTRLAAVEMEALIRALPAPLQDAARDVPIVFERRPDADLVASGIDPDVMGLFEGPSLQEDESGGLPPRIILFLANILEEAEGDEEVFREEVRTTLLHELGHYLGLDESGLFDRELD